MNDWGLALALGLAAVVVSEVTILLAIILPKIPIERGKTWRGTFSAVTTISVIIGGVVGYVAVQFGGRGGGGAIVAGSNPKQESSVSPVPSTPIATQPQSTETVKLEPKLASRVDLYFIQEQNKTVAANFQCRLVCFRRQDKVWKPETISINETKLADFLPAIRSALERIQKEMNPSEFEQRRLRIFLDPDPGEGVYSELRRLAEQAGWKVDRLNRAWNLEKPTS